MKTADAELEDMAVAGNVVLKRTARVAVEYETENEVLEHSGKKATNNTKPDEPTSQKAEGKASRSSVISAAATAMNGASRPYSRRGSIVEHASADLADTNGSQHRSSYLTNGGADSNRVADRPQELPNHIKSSLKSHKLDSLGQDGRPLNFGEVLPGIYRSSFPKAEDYPFYKRLGLKTVV